jgi:hypothetical protein
LRLTGQHAILEATSFITNDIEAEATSSASATG